MTLVIDTSVLIDLERRLPSTILKFKDLSIKYPSPAKITFVNEFEFKFGVRNKNINNKKEALAFLNNFVTLQTTSKTSSLLSELKDKYERKGLLLPLAELLIAALVIENSMTLVTKDKDFEKIEELGLEFI